VTAHPKPKGITYMKRKTYLVSTAAIVAISALGAGVAAATASSGESETPITGPALEQASAVALNETGGGRVSQTEVNDEESYYQVEVTVPDGSQVDVNLDRDFHVVKTKAEKADGSGG
jgi:uncharacterized membrane protein YkoI